MTDVIQRHRDLADAETLEQAADVIRYRSRKPRAFVTLVLCKVLENMARRIREKAGRG